MLLLVQRQNEGICVQQLRHTSTKFWAQWPSWKENKQTNGFTLLEKHFWIPPVILAPLPLCFLLASPHLHRGPLIPRILHSQPFLAARLTPTNGGRQAAGGWLFASRSNVSVMSQRLKRVWAGDEPEKGERNEHGESERSKSGTEVRSGSEGGRAGDVRDHQPCMKLHHLKGSGSKSVKKQTVFFYVFIIFLMPVCKVWSLGEE